MNNIKLILSCKITSTFVLLFLVPLSGNLTQMRIVETILLSEVDFIKVGRRVQIIEIALSICTLCLRPTFEKLFTVVKFQRKGIRRKKSLWNWPLAWDLRNRKADTYCQTSWVCSPFNFVSVYTQWTHWHCAWKIIWNHLILLDKKWYYK